MQQNYEWFTVQTSFGEMYLELNCHSLGLQHLRYLQS